MLIAVWLFFGLAWLSTTLNALQEALTRNIIHNKPEEKIPNKTAEENHLTDNNDAALSGTERNQNESGNLFELHDS